MLAPALEGWRTLLQGILDPPLLKHRYVNHCVIHDLTSPAVSLRHFYKYMYTRIVRIAKAQGNTTNYMDTCEYHPDEATNFWYLPVRVLVMILFYDSLNFKQLNKQLVGM